MKDQLLQIQKTTLERIPSVTDMKELDNIRVEVLGKKGELTAILKGMGKLSNEERPIIGKVANEVKEAIEAAISAKKAIMEKQILDEKLKSQTIDITLDEVSKLPGHAHPLYRTIAEIVEIFESMGFAVSEGPEIEWAKYNFDYLNVPANHPARDESDTFYFNDDVILRTQTSTVQVRAMQAKKPPIKVISPGKVYRFDEIDATHSPLFHQIEGLVVDKNITMADLKGTLDYVAKRLLGSETKTVFRPHQFYFTEPSAEMDATCFVCKGVGCRTCKGTGYIEVLGCGMVHPNVLRQCGIDPDEYSGFAFGMGLDRLTMFKYGITDLRLLFCGDSQFLSQF